MSDEGDAPRPGVGHSRVRAEPPPGARPRARRAVLLAALAASALGLAIRVAVVVRGRDLPPDGCVDLTMARELIAGRTDDALRRKFHPLAAVLEAAVSRSLGRQPDETCGILVSLAGGAIVPFAVALGAVSLLLLTDSRQKRVPRQLARVAFISGTLAACHPNLIEAAATVESYPLAHAALALGVAAALATVVTGRRGAALAAGLAAGLGYLARPDGLVLLAGLAAGLLVAGVRVAGGDTSRKPRRAHPIVGRLATVVLVGVGFAGPATPYVLALHDLTGEYRLTLKKDVRHLVGEQGPTTGVTLVASDLWAQVLDAQRPTDAAAPPEKKGLAGSFAEALRKTSQAANPLVLALAALGVVASWRARRGLLVLGAVLAAFVGAHTLLRANEGYLARDHATGEASLFLILAGVGLAWLADQVARRRALAGERVTAVLLLVAGVALATPAFFGHAVVKSSGERAVAAWIHAHAPPGRELVVAGESTWPVAFLAEARYLGMPTGDAPAAVASARRQGASFLVLYIRSRGASNAPVGGVRATVEKTGLAAPEIFREERPDAASGVIVYTWLVYPIPGGNQ